MNNTDSLSFTIPLASEAHRLAARLCDRHRDVQKAKQIYLNTVTVYAVNYYLQCLGVETSWEASASWNPALQTLMDVADLEVVNCGTLECCPIVSTDRIAHITPEARENRIGFVLVQLNEALTEATLLGFSPTLENGTLSVHQLRSLDDLADYLSPAPVSQLAANQTAANQTAVNLKGWFHNLFEEGWQALEQLLETNALVLSPAYRSASTLDATHPAQAPDTIRGAKLIHLGDSSGHLETVTREGCTVNFLIFLVSQQDERTRIVLQVHPTQKQSYLPGGLRLQILSESGELLQDIEAGSTNDYIQKQLIAREGESFRVRIVVGEASWIENFVL